MFCHDINIWFDKYIVIFCRHHASLQKIKQLFSTRLALLNHRLVCALMSHVHSNITSFILAGTTIQPQPLDEVAAEIFSIQHEHAREVNIIQLQNIFGTEIWNIFGDRNLKYFCSKNLKYFWNRNLKYFYLHIINTL